MNQNNKILSLIYDLIIIGGGPAGLTAGLCSSRARLKTLLIENFSPGGQIIAADKVENFPGFPEGIKGFDLTEKIKRQAENFGLKIIFDKVSSLEEESMKDIKLWKVKTENNVYETPAVILSVGAEYKELNIPGEGKFKGKGISYCATCDGVFFQDKVVVVAGGGDTALEEALFLTKFAKKVIVIHRRDKLRAAKILQERAVSNKKIEFILNSAAVEILGTSAVEAVEIKNLKNNNQTILACQGIFVSIGLKPHTDFIKDLIKLDEQGYIVTGSNTETSQKGIFAAGDCRSKILRQLITACGDGATAAFSAQQYIDELKQGAIKE